MAETEQRAPQPLRGSSRASKTTTLYSFTSHTYLTNDFCASIRCQGLLAPRWCVSRGLGLLLPQVCLMAMEEGSAFSGGTQKSHCIRFIPDPVAPGVYAQRTSLE